MWTSKYGSELNTLFGHLLTHLALVYREFKLAGNKPESPKLKQALMHVVFGLRNILEAVGDIDSTTVFHTLFNIIFEMFEKVNSGQVKNLSEFVESHSVKYLKDKNALREYIGSYLKKRKDKEDSDLQPLLKSWINHIISPDQIIQKFGKKVWSEYEHMRYFTSFKENHLEEYKALTQK